jgi:hypothetical protein
MTSDLHSRSNDLMMSYGMATVDGTKHDSSMHDRNQAGLVNLQASSMEMHTSGWLGCE